MMIIASLCFGSQNSALAKTQMQVGSGNWTLYTDTRFSYSFEYPTGWGVEYRDDAPGTYGEPLLVYPNGQTENTFGIYVGNYSTKIQSNESLLDWTNQYNQLMDTFDLVPHTVVSTIATTVNGKEAVNVTLDIARYTNVRVGDVVWFVWSNVDTTTNQDYVVAYNHAVSTFTFSASAPTSLAMINGVNANAQNLVELTQINAVAKSTNGVVATVANTNFRLPFVGFHYVTLGPSCLPTHVGASGEAIDYGLSTGEEVIPSESGTVIFAGWNTYGYGNLVNIDHGSGYVSYYAHLNYINISVGTTVNKGWTTLGQSGNTGNSSGPHLHFEVQKNGSAYSVRNMAGQALYSPTCDPNRTYDGTATGPSKETPPSQTFSKISPQNGATIPLPDSTLYLLQWENNSIDSFQYCVDESNNNLCNFNWINRKSYSGPGEFILVAGHTYYWQVRRVDNGLEANNGIWWSFTVQPNYPSVISIARSSSTPTNATSVSFTVTFDQPVIGVDTSDFSLTTTGVLGASVSGVSGSGSIYNVTVNTGTGSGTIQLNLVDNDSIINSQNTPLGGVGAGNGNYSGETYIIDKAAPTVVSTVPPVTATTVSINFTVTFSEFVTGVDNPNDFSLTTSGNVTGASITSVSGTAPNNIYTVQVNTGNIGSGTIRLNVVNNGTIKDLALNTLNGVFNNGVLYNKPTFADVPVTDWAWQYTERMYNAQITTGCDGANYCPQTNVTRAEVAVFVERALHGGSYQPPVVPLSFNDTSGHWAQYWIERFKSEGITTGCGGGKYCPDQNVTRAEMSVFILRALHGGSYQPPVVGLTFNDTTGHWAQYWIEQFKTEGITTGCGGGKYCPDQNVTRAEMAVFIVRAFGYPVLP